ncbi:hypothetical protein NSERUTF1_4942 [Nocardia seriolae]|nr:hypothetical protein NSERUTF1_4942 [Nocardia seriolae]
MYCYQRSVASQSFRGGTADAPARAGHQGRLACQFLGFAHESILRTRSFDYRRGRGRRLVPEESGTTGGYDKLDS